MMSHEFLDISENKWYLLLDSTVWGFELKIICLVFGWPYWFVWFRFLPKASADDVNKVIYDFHVTIEAEPPEMEGILWKWTNYWTGWQPRWFVLDGGVLVYYQSQEEVSQGCKGSLKISACEISVSQTDTLRLDLNLPGELHYYLRASTSQERQQWLVALGSAKACEGITKETPEPGTPSAEQAAGSITFHAVRPSAGAIEGDKDLLKTKRSELRLYCDLLMQQVHSVKDAATQMPKPDVDKLEESTHLLGATCDTFISTLEDCLRLAKADPYSHPPEKWFNGSHERASPTFPPSPSNSTGTKKALKTKPANKVTTQWSTGKKSDATSRCYLLQWETKPVDIKQEETTLRNLRRRP